MSNQKTELYILAAKIAAELHFATSVARQLSLTAKNAHAVSARAGQQAAGFRAITSFIEELAASTITQSMLINQRAIAISNLVTHRERTHRALDQFIRVSRTAAAAPYISSISLPIAKAQQEMNTLDYELRDRLWQLEMKLQETQQQIRAADIISSTSKVEASQAGAFKPQLEVIAQNISESAARIKKHLQQAYRLLSMASVQMNNNYTAPTMSKAS